MTEKDIKLAVIVANNTLSTNNPKGLTQALKDVGYPVDGRFDILSNDALNKALLELYITDPVKWGQVMQSVSFNYQKTDSSTSQNTKALFDNITKSFNPNENISTQRGKFSDFFNKALGYIVGSTTTTHMGISTNGQKPPIWAYVGLSVIGIIILVIVYMALKTKNI